MSNNKEKDDNLTVSRVYDTLKSPLFLKNIYWNILSCIKDKNTYKVMREVAEAIINQNMKGLDSLGSSDQDIMRRKTIVAEISVMSYTIDTVFSKILYMKLEKACKEQIVKFIHELRQEGKIPENVWSRINLNVEASGSQTSTEDALVKANSAQLNEGSKKLPTRVGKRSRIATSKLQDIARANTNKEILDDLAKVNNLKYTSKNEANINDTKGNSSKERVEGTIKECPKKNMLNKYPVATLTRENVSKLQNSIHNIRSKDFFDSDTQDSSDDDSEISVGGCESVVSSVHTSDLSSFDDEISLSSDDEITLSSDDENRKKKKMPLKEVQKRYYQTKALNSSENKKNVKSVKSEVKEEPIGSVAEYSNTTNPNTTKKEEPSGSVAENSNATNPNTTKKVSTNNAAMSTKQSVSFSESSGGNGLSKRARKPNSRYSSENILCPVVKVKERKKPIKTYSKMFNNELSPPNKKAKVDNVYRDAVTISKSVNKEETSNNVKTPSKQPESLGLFKPQTANRSLTSRRTAPLTLFST